MRIENNNNVNFGAYFKQNAQFNRLFADAPQIINKDLVNKFATECPKHEVEILDLKFQTNVITAQISNNNLGNRMVVGFRCIADGLHSIMQKLTDNSEDTTQFWNDDCMKDLYKKLITPQKQ